MKFQRSFNYQRLVENNIYIHYAGFYFHTFLPNDLVW